MPERVHAIEMVQVSYLCDQPDCGKDQVFTGARLLSDPPRYVHECANGHRTNLTKVYPGEESRLVAPRTRFPR